MRHDRSCTAARGARERPNQRFWLYASSLMASAHDRHASVRERELAECVVLPVMFPSDSFGSDAEV